MVNNSTNMNTTNNHLTHQPIEHRQGHDIRYMTLKMEVLTWDRYEIVAG